MRRCVAVVRPGVGVWTLLHEVWRLRGQRRGVVAALLLLLLLLLLSLPRPLCQFLRQPHLLLSAPTPQCHRAERVRRGKSGLPRGTQSVPRVVVVQTSVTSSATRSGTGIGLRASAQVRLMVISFAVSFLPFRFQPHHLPVCFSPSAGALRRGQHAGSPRGHARGNIHAGPA
jgi:hypothetical protein